MNKFHTKLTELPELRNIVGHQRTDEILVELLLLVEELDIELDGIALPGSASAIINRFRIITEEMTFRKKC